MHCIYLNSTIIVKVRLYARLVKMMRKEAEQGEASRRLGWYTGGEAFGERELSKGRYKHKVNVTKQS